MSRLSSSKLEVYFLYQIETIVNKIIPMIQEHSFYLALLLTP